MGTSSQPQLDAEEAQAQYHASLSDWRMFRQSKAWQDLQTYLRGAIEEAKDMLSIEFEERAVPESDASLRGGIKIAKRVLAFPDEQIEELTVIEEREENAV